MKMIAAILLSALTIPAHAQRLLGTLETHQKDISPKPSQSSDPGNSEVTVEPVGKTKTAGQCTEQDQTSLPLAYVTSLIMEKNGKLDITHDARTGKLMISSPEMISNCSSMIEWAPNARMVDGRKVYSVEAKIKDGEECDDDGCTYDVAKVEKGQFKSFEKIKLKPTMAGFEDCLEKSGVIVGGKVVSDAIYPSSIDEKFDGFKETGELLFLSHGPSSKLVKAKYDKFVEIDKCDHYEKILPNGLVLQSLDDEERERILSEKAKIRDCGEYEKIADFIEKYQGYAEDLNEIRDKLILEAVKKASKNISEGNFSDEDLKALADFEKYIIQPKVDLANLLYQEAEGLDGEEKQARLNQMKAVLQELTSYLQAPYLTAGVVQKLEDTGRFDDAIRANGMRALVVSHVRLGQKENGVLVTPDVARVRSLQLKQAYATELEDVKEKFEIRTGQTTGYSQQYAQLAQRLQQNIQVRTQNYNQEIAAEYARVQQPNGYCYRSPFRNVQKCIQRSMERIQELQAQLQHFNQVDAQRAIEYQQKAQEYAKLEKEGRDYIARQNGEQPPANIPVDNTVPSPRVDDDYTFQSQYNPYAQQGQTPYVQGQMNPYAQQQGNMFQQQYNPYSQQQMNPYAQQNPYMGQQNWNNQFQVGYQFNGNMYSNQYPSNQYMTGQYNPYQQSAFQQQYNPFQQYQQPQQQGYWQNPYSAYNPYSMYR